MTILQSIQQWSQDLPAWEQHAIARLYADQRIDPPEMAVVYALLKSHHGVPDPEGYVGDKLEADQVAAPQANGSLVQLVAIRNLRNVNALAEGQTLPVSPTGLTVIYGENGAGKSGYSRVLKKACRARDQREPILPNAHKPPGEVGPPAATFELLVNDKATAVEWNGAAASPEQLSALAIFDAHCARAYVDNHGDFAYAPYGLDILEGLVAACVTLKAMANAERARNQPNTLPFEALGRTKTVVGVLLTNLSSNTKPEAVEELATLSSEQTARLAIIVKTLAEADPKQKAQTFRLRAMRFGQLASRVNTAKAHVSADRVATLKTMVAASIAAVQAAKLAAKGFEETPGLLRGTGGDAWKALLEAARSFAGESHGEGAFPHLGPEAACPLCQNTLGVEGSARLEAFDAFIQQAAEKAAKSARGAAIAAYRALEGASTDLVIEDALRKELEDNYPDLAVTCALMQQTLTARQAATLKASAPDGNWDIIPPLLDDPTIALEETKAQLLAQAKALEDSLDAKARSAMVLEHAELDARRLLADLKGSVLDAIAKHATQKKLQDCIDAVATGPISRKSTELAKLLATPAVVAALNAELKALDVHELHIAMKNASTQGKAQFKLTLEVPGGGSPTSILSEGEQRAIAIASFLAEINLSTGRGGVVFDDPVSSLDHRRRWHVAKRLAEEAVKRQVIVLTHDIYFLCVLQEEAQTAKVEALIQCIRKDEAGFGVQSDRLPFDAHPTTRRVKELRAMHQAVAAAHRAQREEECRSLTWRAYFHLRMAWERAVEEVLFQSVVTRFGEGVSTQKLKYVTVEDADHAAVDAGMTRCSKFAHDPAARAQLPTPHPDEVIADIEQLDVWRLKVEGRKAAVAAARG